MEFLIRRAAASNRFYPTQDEVFYPSFANKYFPLYAIFHFRYLFKTIEQGVSYPRIGSESFYYLRNGYKYLYQALEGFPSPMKYEFTYKGIRENIYAFKGTIITLRNEVLMCVVFNNLKFFNPNLSDIESAGLKVLVSSRMITEAKYSNIFKKLCADYFPYFLERGISMEIVQHGDIEKNIFNSGLINKDDIKSMEAFENSLELNIDAFVNFRENNELEVYKGFIQNIENMERINSELENVLLIDE